MQRRMFVTLAASTGGQIVVCGDGRTAVTFSLSAGQSTGSSSQP
jgi:hypothetical protein